MGKADIIVNDHRYSIACADGQEGRLQALATDLDARVKRIANAVGDIGEARLLLVAGLALLDELDDASQGRANSQMVGRAAGALGDAAARIEALAARIDAGKPA